MLTKRVISCLDVRDGKLAKSIQFQGTIDIGDPVEKAHQYYEAGLDELVFYDITASHEGRGIILDVVRRVAAQVFIPFSVGGGLRSVADGGRVLEAGAEKVNYNSRCWRRRRGPSVRRQWCCPWTCCGPRPRHSSRPVSRS